ncbi:MAG: flagellar biosynthetic protein FliQ [Bryobacterales bacterium]|nr:flagellar biosynthetic protein FliQ [Bryobacterales bacterium]
MNAEQIADLIRQTFWTTFWLGLPLLALGFLTGILVSLIQIVTSIQDSSFGAAPRLLAFLAALVIFLPWMLARLVGYTTALFGDFSRYAR